MWSGRGGSGQTVNYGMASVGLLSEGPASSLCHGCGDGQLWSPASSSRPEQIRWSFVVSF